MQLQPYLFFNGRCEEALEFYKKTLGAEVTLLLRMKDSPEPHPPGTLPPGSEDKIMHAHLRIGTVDLMASDGMAAGGPNFQGFSLSLAYPSESQAQKVFAELARSGRVDLPIGKTFWSPCFGMVADPFDVRWMITVEAQ